MAVQCNSEAGEIFEAKKFHIQVLNTAIKFFKVFERKECELIPGYRFLQIFMQHFSPLLGKEPSIREDTKTKNSKVKR